MAVSPPLAVFKITFTTAVICRSVCNEMSFCYCPVPQTSVCADVVLDPGSAPVSSRNFRSETLCLVATVGFVVTFSVPLSRACLVNIS